MAGGAVLHHLLVAVFVDGCCVVKRVFADALWHRLAKEQRAITTVRAHQFWIRFQHRGLDHTNFALKLLALIASKTWVADAVRQSAITPINAFATAGAVNFIPLGVRFSRAVKVFTERPLSSRPADAHHVV